MILALIAILEVPHEVRKFVQRAGPPVIDTRR